MENRLRIFKNLASREAIKEFAINELVGPKPNRLATYCVILTDGGEANESYIRSKSKILRRFDIEPIVNNFNDEQELTKQIYKVSRHRGHPIIVQKSLTKPKEYFDVANECISKLSLDAEGMFDISTRQKPERRVYPCTAWGIFKYIKHVANIANIKNPTVAILGRSDIVGQPLNRLLCKDKEMDSTVIMMHSKTDALLKGDVLADADFVVSATGKVQSWNTKKPQFVFDVGCLRDSTGKLKGEVHKTSENQVITPVPGGVGVLTTHALVGNIRRIYNYIQHHDYVCIK